MNLNLHIKSRHVHVVSLKNERCLENLPGIHTCSETCTPNSGATHVAWRDEVVGGVVGR